MNYLESLQRLLLEGLKNRNSPDNGIITTFTLNIIKYLLTYLICDNSTPSDNIFSIFQQ